MTAPDVLMRHPDIKVTTPSRTTREAFDQVWKPKGWVEVGAEQVASSEPTASDPPDSDPPDSGATPQTAGRPGKGA